MGINKDQVKGQVNVVKGSVKEAAGKLVGNPNLEAEGKVQKIVGKVQTSVGDVEQNLKHASKKGG